MTAPVVTGFFEDRSCTISYVVADASTGHAAIIDPVLDYDAASAHTNTSFADRLIDHVESNQYSVDWILETHVHADHLTATPYLSDKLGARTGIGANVVNVQRTFRDVFNLVDLATDGSQFDCLFTDGETFTVGDIEARVIATPGHTPACVTYVVGDAAFVGDTLFMPDYGTARTDFPGGDAGELYDSIRKIFALPKDTRLFTCHDYKAPGRDAYAWESTVGGQRSMNVHARDGISREEFVAFRENRDAKLGMPALILPAIQVNVRAGALPPPEANGVRYLKLPLDFL